MNYTDPQTLRDASQTLTPRPREGVSDGGIIVLVTPRPRSQRAHAVLVRDLVYAEDHTQETLGRQPAQVA